jgi:hypothetical protein
MLTNYELRNIWEKRSEGGIEQVEGVRRCYYCGAREDRHNLTADMQYYNYKAHAFEYPSEAQIAEWKFEANPSLC